MGASAVDLLASFEAGTLDPATFHHQDHIRLAWAHLRRYPLPAAAERVSAGLRLLAWRAGKPGRYHETITWAFLVLINERMELGGRELAWEAFEQRNPDLLRGSPSLLATSYYAADVLVSDLARRVFVLPRGRPE